MLKPLSTGSRISSREGCRESVPVSVPPVPIRELVAKTLGNSRIYQFHQFPLVYQFPPPNNNEVVGGLIASKGAIEPSLAAWLSARNLVVQSHPAAVARSRLP